MAKKDETMDAYIDDMLELFDKGVAWPDIVKQLSIPQSLRRPLWNKLIALRGATMRRRKAEREDDTEDDAPSERPAPLIPPTQTVEGFKAGVEAVQEGIKIGTSLSGSKDDTPQNAIVEAFRQIGTMFEAILNRLDNHPNQADSITAIATSFQTGMQTFTKAMQESAKEQREYMLEMLRADKEKMAQFLQQTRQMEQEFLKKQTEILQQRMDSISEITQIAVEAAKSKMDDLSKMTEVMENVFGTVKKLSETLTDIKQPETRLDQVLTHAINGVTQSINKWLDIRAATGGGYVAPQALPQPQIQQGQRAPQPVLRSQNMILDAFKQIWESIKQVGIRAWLKSKAKDLPEGVLVDFKDMFVTLITENAPPMMFVNALHEILMGAGLGGYVHSINMALFTLKYDDLLDILAPVCNKDDVKALKSENARRWWSRVKQTLAQGYDYAATMAASGVGRTPPNTNPHSGTS